MATNEDLAIAFLCLCDKRERDEVIEFVLHSTERWDDKENVNRIVEGLRLPVSMIQRKIALLHTGLLQCPTKKQIYEDMANRLASMTAGMRSPVIKPRSDKSNASYMDFRDHVVPISLNSNQTT
jgi:hypothetical protein